MSNMLLVPVVSEKALDKAEKANTYAFIVPKNSTKISVAQAIAERFSVKVLSVNTTIHKGKSTQSIVKRGRGRINGRRADVKKAYVTLKAGDKISAFEGGK